MDKIDKHLASCAVDTAYSPALRGAFKLGKDLLNKYYSLTDSSDVYRIAISELFLIFFCVELMYH